MKGRFDSGGCGRTATKLLFPQWNCRFRFTSGAACSYLCTPGLGRFHRQSIFEPGEPQCANACGFFNSKHRQLDRLPVRE
jgi:hypothetical protein